MTTDQPGVITLSGTGGTLGHYFETRDASSGDLDSSSTLPTVTLYLDGAATGQTATVSLISTGLYYASASFTGLSLASKVSLRIDNVTVDAVAQSPRQVICHLQCCDYGYGTTQSKLDEIVAYLEELTAGLPAGSGGAVGGGATVGGSPASGGFGRPAGTDVQLHQDDDYSGDFGVTFTITNPAIDFTGATVLFGAGTEPGSPTLTGTPSVVSAGDGELVAKVEFARANLQFSPGQLFYTLKAVIGGKRHTVIDGVCLVSPSFVDFS